VIYYIEMVKVAPAVLEHPEARTTGGNPMAKKSLLQDTVPNEVQRTILREAEDRYRNELMNDEERMLLLDRIRRLRRTLGVLAR
jgi:hypothetical protein